MKKVLLTIVLALVILGCSTKPIPNNVLVDYAVANMGCDAEKTIVVQIRTTYSEDYSICIRDTEERILSDYNAAVIICNSNTVIVTYSEKTGVVVITTVDSTSPEQE